ncbi:hypothetical protein CN916_05325 [Bacillus thuringiensis]|nr:hypothetical protein CN916_05325 [Bacillus thuringiensis]
MAASFRYSNSCKKLTFIHKTVSGVVKDILTNTETHTYRIKVWGIRKRSSNGGRPLSYYAWLVRKNGSFCTM